ncbi:MAG: hypothetical protein WAU07_02400 [Microgenomates group bacterium]
MNDPTSQATPATPQQNPLDVLEKLLEDTKKQGAAASGNGGPTVAPGPSPEEIAAQEKAKLVAEYESLKEEHALEDQKALEKQQVVMEELKHTPQYQARIDQEADKQVLKQGVKEDQLGLEIRQLEKKKIVVQE